MSDVDSMIDRAMVKIGEAATAGDRTKVKEILRNLLETATAAAAAQAHQQRLAEIGEDSQAICRYYGELGITHRETEDQLGRKLTEEEKDEMTKGAFDRRAEARALELGQARQGGKVLPWMTSLS